MTAKELREKLIHWPNDTEVWFSCGCNEAMPSEDPVVAVTEMQMYKYENGKAIPNVKVILLK